MLKISAQLEQLSPVSLKGLTLYTQDLLYFGFENREERTEMPSFGKTYKLSKQRSLPIKGKHVTLILRLAFTFYQLT
jgi:hypothetical protein